MQSPKISTFVIIVENNGLATPRGSKVPEEIRKADLQIFARSPEVDGKSSYLSGLKEGVSYLVEFINKDIKTKAETFKVIRASNVE